jgi:hypothetical protein
MYLVERLLLHNQPPTEASPLQTELEELFVLYFAMLPFLQDELAKTSLHVVIHTFFMLKKLNSF